MSFNIDEITYKEAKEIIRLFGGGDSSPIKNDMTISSGTPFKIGEQYLIRTVTMIVLGKLEWIGSSELVLSSGSWVADTDRFYNALKDGKLKEVEPFINDVIVGRGSIIDATIWGHNLPREQKG